LQDFDCLNKTAELWPVAFQGLEDESLLNNLPPHVRTVVYNYHFQNTYNVDDYRIVLDKYNIIYDLQEQARLMEALTFSRLPWLLADFFEATNGVHFMDFFDVVRLLSNNPLGREIMWDTLRINYADYLEIFGQEEPKLGQMVIDVAHSFENEFLFNELVRFIMWTPDAAAGHARFKALEMVSTNVVWLEDKEAEIEHAFSGVHSPKKTADATKPFQVKAQEYLENTFGPNWLSLLHKKLRPQHQ